MNTPDFEIHVQVKKSADLKFLFFITHRYNWLSYLTVVLDYCKGFTELSFINRAKIDE